MESVDVGTKKYVLCDFKSEAFTLQQAIRAGTLLDTVLKMEGAKELFAVVQAATSENGGIVPFSTLFTQLGNFTSVLKSDELAQLFCVFYLPEDVRYNEEYDNTLASRASAAKFDIPFGPLVRAVVSFFASKTSPVASSPIGTAVGE